jgi:tetratricopeptide (TPR) repeat protein
VKAKTLWLTLAIGILLSPAALLAAPGPQSASGRSLHLNPEEVRKQMASSHDELVDVNNQSTITKYLQAFSGSTSQEDKQQIVSELTDYCVQRGLRPSPDIAELFLSLALDAKAQGNGEEFLRLCQYAESFDPGHPAVHLVTAAAIRQQSGFFSGQYLYEVLMAFFSSFKSVETRWIALSNLALWLRATAFLVLGVLSLLLLVKYQAQLRHDVKEWLGGGDSSLVQLAGFVVLFLPSLLFLAGYWWIIYWAGIFMIYAKWPERVTTILATLLFLVSGALALHNQQQMYLAQSPPNVSNIRCYANRIGVGLDGYLAGHIGDDDPLNRPYAFLLASRYLLHGSYLKAENTYQPLLSQSAQDAEVCNNLGCIYYYENRYQEAVQQFSKAIDYKPGLAISYLNRSLAENKLFDFSGAKDDQDKARSINPRLFETYNLRQSEDWGPIPSWLPLAATEELALRQEAQHPGSLKGPLSLGASWPALLIRPPFSLWLAIFVLGFTAVAVAKKASFFARACLKCGRPFCNRCKTSLEFESFCSQCVHLYIKQDGVSPEARLKKNYEVESYNQVQRIQRAAVSLCAPGAGHFLEDRPYSALFLLFLWCGLVAGLFASAYAFPLPFPGLIGTAALKSVFAVVAVALMALLWGLFGLPIALRQEPPQLGRLLKG